MQNYSNVWNTFFGHDLGSEKFECKYSLYTYVHSYTHTYTYRQYIIGY